ncbi:MAG: hypothetical protein EA380_03975, partial [Phycisphaeraceae bacterium]
GLALQGLELTPVKANLVPVSVIRDEMWKRKTPVFIAAALIALAGGAASFFKPITAQGTIPNISEMRELTSAKNLGTRLKREAEEAMRETELAFAPINVLRLFVGKDLHGYVLADIAAMLQAAEGRRDIISLAPAVADHRDPDREVIETFIYDLASWDVSYVRPGDSLRVARGDEGGGRPRPRPGADDGAPTGPTAGQFGALRITLQLDANSDDRAAFNDTVLAWLRENAERPGWRYTLAGVPTIGEVGYTEIRAANAAMPNRPGRPGAGDAPGDGPRPGRPGGDERPGGGGGVPGGGGGVPPGGGGGVPPGGGGGVPDGGGGSPRPGDGSPRPGGGPTPPGESGPTDLAGLAPLPQSPIRLSTERPVFRYTVTFFANLADPEAPVGQTAGGEQDEQDPEAVGSGDPRGDEAGA